MAANQEEVMVNGRPAAFLDKLAQDGALQQQNLEQAEKQRLAEEAKKEKEQKEKEMARLKKLDIETRQQTVKGLIDEYELLQRVFIKIKFPGITQQQVEEKVAIGKSTLERYRDKVEDKSSSKYLEQIKTIRTKVEKLQDLLRKEKIDNIELTAQEKEVYNKLSISNSSRTSSEATSSESSASSVVAASSSSKEEQETAKPVVAKTLEAANESKKSAVVEEKTELTDKELEYLQRRNQGLETEKQQCEQKYQLANSKLELIEKNRKLAEEISELKNKTEIIYSKDELKELRREVNVRFTRKKLSSSS